MEKGKGLMEEEEYYDEDAKYPPRMFRPDIPLVWAERRSSYKTPYTFEEQLRYNTERRKPYFNPDLLPGPPPESFSKYPSEPFFDEPIPMDEYLKITANDPPRRSIPRRPIPVFKNNVQRSTFKPEDEPDVFHILQPKGGRVKVLGKSNDANKPVVEILKPATPFTEFINPEPATPITDPMLLEDDAAASASSGTKPEVKGRFGLECPNEDLDLGSGKDVITNLNPLAYSSVETGATSDTYAEAGYPLDEMWEEPILKPFRKAVF